MLQNVISILLVGFVGMVFPVEANADEKFAVQGQNSTAKQDVVTIYSHSIPGVFDDNNQGYYNKLWNSLRSKGVKNFTFTFSTETRKIRNFILDKSSCTFITRVDKSHFETEHNIDVSELLFSDPTTITSLKVYSKRGIAAVRSLDDLKNKAVISTPDIIANMKTDNKIPTTLSVIKVENSRQVMTMLESGRADYGIVFDLDAKMYVKDGFDPFPQDPKFSIVQIREGMVCHDTLHTKALMDSFNNRILALKKSQAREGIFNKLD